MKHVNYKEQNRNLLHNKLRHLISKSGVVKHTDADISSCIIVDQVNGKMKMRVYLFINMLFDETERAIDFEYEQPLVKQESGKILDVAYNMYADIKKDLEEFIEGGRQ